MKNSFVKQAAILAGAGLLVKFIGFLYKMPLTDLIGDTGNGIYNLGFQIYSFLLILSSAGLPTAVSRLVSERMALGQHRNAHKVFLASLTVAVGFGFVAALTLWFGAEMFANWSLIPESFYSIRTLAPTVFIVAIMAVFRGYFQGMNSMVPTALSQVFEQIFNAVFSIFLAYRLVGKGVEYGAAGGTAGTGIGALAGLIVVVIVYVVLKPVIKKRVRYDLDYMHFEEQNDLIKKVVATAIPIIAGSAIYSVAGIIDTRMMMSRLLAGGFSLDTATSMVGQFSGKYSQLTNLPVAISASIAAAAIPSIVSSHVLKHKKDVNNKINISLRVSMVLSIPCAVGMGVLAEQILLFLFPSYPGGAMLLRVGSFGIIFMALMNISTGMLQGIGRITVPAFAAFCGVVIKIPLNYILISIPALNIIGAVISTIICYAVASFINMYVLSNITHTRPDLMGAIVKPAIASGMMGLGCYVFYYTIYSIKPSNAISLAISVIVGIIIYFAFMLLIGGLKRSDLRTIPMGGHVIRLMDVMGL